MTAAEWQFVCFSTYFANDSGANILMKYVMSHDILAAGVRLMLWRVSDTLVKRQTGAMLWSWGAKGTLVTKAPIEFPMLLPGSIKPPVRYTGHSIFRVDVIFSVSPVSLESSQYCFSSAELKIDTKRSFRVAYFDTDFTTDCYTAAKEVVRK
jgi:hypothetical protein